MLHDLLLSKQSGSKRVACDLLEENDGDCMHCIVLIIVLMIANYCNATFNVSAESDLCLQRSVYRPSVCCSRYGHIISNLVFQLVLGIPLEMVHKFWRVGVVYCLGVIAGQLVCSHCPHQ